MVSRMQTKLTLRIDQALIERAKSHGRRTGKSVSQMVADFFHVLDEPPPDPSNEPPAPLVESLRGILGTAGVEEFDYRRHLEEKHG